MEKQDENMEILLEDISDSDEYIPYRIQPFIYMEERDDKKCLYNPDIIREREMNKKKQLSRLIEWEKKEGIVIKGEPLYKRIQNMKKIRIQKKKLILKTRQTY